MERVLIYRMTHINNIPHIVIHGITHRSSIASNRNYEPIGDNSIISTRNTFRMKSGRNLGDYIPFYFGVRMPMLYVIQRGFNGVALTTPEDIVYCVSSLDEINTSGIEYIFTDGHAVDSFSLEYSANEVKNIAEILDYTAIRCLNWKDENDLDKKRRMEAEFLLSEDLPAQYILGYICYNEVAQDKLISAGVPAKMIAIRPHYYF